MFLNETGGPIPARMQSMIEGRVKGTQKEQERQRFISMVHLLQQGGH